MVVVVINPLARSLSPNQGTLKEEFFAFLRLLLRLLVRGPPSLQMTRSLCQGLSGASLTTCLKGLSVSMETC